MVSDHSRSVRWKPCDARATSQHSEGGGGGEEGLAFDGSEKWSSTLGVSMDASRPNTSKFLVRFGLNFERSESFRRTVLTVLLLFCAHAKQSVVP